ncbi:hypothetical protein ABZ646_32480 [Streptomyces sp. NPDC007162]|uniref:hypothetical protein n=1 Tax=Streptomyces sp. NPDC007162 TaxID=3156917 RepID=UPI0033FF0FAA
MRGLVETGARLPLADSEHLCKRRAEDPAVPVQHLVEEIKALGFAGCLNLLHKYLNQGRADADRSHISPRRLARKILTRPDNLKTDTTVAEVVVYEADQIEPCTRTGWSVMVTRITAPADVARYQILLIPWIEGDTDHIVAIATELVTGYRLER